MRKRLSLFVLIASALTFLASLYLTWVVATIDFGRLNLEASTYEGWGTFGGAAALFALASVTGAGWLLVRPRPERRLPLASCAFALMFFALANLGEAHGAGVSEAAYNHLRVHLGAGAYLGVASATVAFLAAVALRWDELARRPSATAVVAAGLSLGLLAAFLLPWLHVHFPHTVSGATSGIRVLDLGNVLVVFIAALALFGLRLWRGGAPPGSRLVTAVGIVVLIAGYLSPLGTHRHWPYESWLALGCALGLLALALVSDRGLRTSFTPVADAAAVAAASLLVTSLFLPWQKGCAQGACISSNGWSTLVYTATAGGLAVLLVVLLVGFRLRVFELALGAAIYVMVTGFQLTQYSHLAYGAPLGFAGAALLLVAAARWLQEMTVERKRLLVRVFPLAACLAFLAIPVATLTGRLSLHLEFDSPWQVYWLEVGAILVGLRLLGRWLGGPKADDELVLLPLALLALTVLGVVFVRRELGIINWEGWLSVGLCLFLAALGWIERSGGLEKFRVPEEIWRVDRLPS